MSIFGAFDPVGNRGGLTQGEIQLQNTRARIAQENLHDAKVNNIHSKYQARIRELEIKLAVETAYGIASHQQFLALRSTLKEVAPNHQIFQKTGRKRKDGTDETNLSVIFTKNFDDNLRGKVPGNPSDYRNA